MSEDSVKVDPKTLPIDEAVQTAITILKKFMDDYNTVGRATITINHEFGAINISV